MFEQYVEHHVVRNEKNMHRKKLMVIKILKVISIILLIAFILFAFMSPATEEMEIWQVAVQFLICLVPAVSFLFAWIGLNYYGKSLTIEYDYVLSGQMLRIIKVINNNKRKKYLEISLSNVDCIGKVAFESYVRYASTPGIKKENAIVNAEDENAIYFMVCNTDGGKKLVHLEPSEEIIHAIRMAVGRDIVLKK